ncbi:unnamed protein product [Effrenium voratum]|nr:unnamed protein product [Effrenium voratum]
MGSADKGKVLIMNPEEYAAAAGELLVISIIISWILTYFFNYGIIADNQLKRRLGYNNLCVGWDEPPAQLVAAPIFVGIIWLQMRRWAAWVRRALTWFDACLWTLPT